MGAIVFERSADRPETQCSEALMRENDRRNLRNMSTASAVGIVIVVSVVIGFLLGRWLDRIFGTDPWLLLVFTILGVAAGFIEMYRMVKSISED